MQRKSYFIFLLLLIITLLATSAEAKSGCCSSHGGVCGNSCCDGSALSVACGGTSTSTQKTESQASQSQYTCSDEYISERFCVGQSIYQLHRLSNCSRINESISFCSWQCNNGTCTERPTENITPLQNNAVIENITNTTGNAQTQIGFLGKIMALFRALFS